MIRLGKDFENKQGRTAEIPGNLASLNHKKKKKKKIEGGGERVLLKITRHRKYQVWHDNQGGKAVKREGEREFISQ